MKFTLTLLTLALTLTACSGSSSTPAPVVTPNPPKEIPAEAPYAGTWIWAVVDADKKFLGQGYMNIVSKQENTGSPPEQLTHINTGDYTLCDDKLVSCVKAYQARFFRSTSSKYPDTRLVLVLNGVSSDPQVGAFDLDDEFEKSTDTRDRLTFGGLGAWKTNKGDYVLAVVVAIQLSSLSSSSTPLSTSVQLQNIARGVWNSPQASGLTLAQTRGTHLSVPDSTLESGTLERSTP